MARLSCTLCGGTPPLGEHLSEGPDGAPRSLQCMSELSVLGIRARYCRNCLMRHGGPESVSRKLSGPLTMDQRVALLVSEVPRLAEPDALILLEDYISFHGWPVAVRPTRPRKSLVQWVADLRDWWEALPPHRRTDEHHRLHCLELHGYPAERVYEQDSAGVTAVIRALGARHAAVRHAAFWSYGPLLDSVLGRQLDDIRGQSCAKPDFERRDAWLRWWEENRGVAQWARNGWFIPAVSDAIRRTVEARKPIDTLMEILHADEVARRNAIAVLHGVFGEHLPVSIPGLRIGESGRLDLVALEAQLRRVTRPLVRVVRSRGDTVVRGLHLGPLCDSCAQWHGWEVEGEEPRPPASAAPPEFWPSGIEKLRDVPVVGSPELRWPDSSRLANELTWLSMRVLSLAQDLTLAEGRSAIGTEHVLLSLIRWESGGTIDLLRDLDVGPEALLPRLAAAMASRSPASVSGPPAPSADTAAVLEFARQSRGSARYGWTATQDLVVHLGIHDPGIAGTVLRGLGLTPEKLHAAAKGAYFAPRGRRWADPDRFDPLLLRVLSQARQERCELGGYSFGASETLIGLAWVEAAIPDPVYAVLGMDAWGLAEFGRWKSPWVFDPCPKDELVPTDSLARALDAAEAEARTRGDARIGTGHLLLGLVAHGETLLCELLGDRKVSTEAFGDTVRVSLDGGDGRSRRS